MSDSLVTVFLVGLAAGGFGGYRAGVWWSLRQLGAVERRERQAKIHGGK